MHTQKYKIKGLRPYVFTRPTKDKTPKTEKEAIKVAMNRVYSNGNGLFIPDRQIKGVVLGGISISKMKIERSNKRALDLVKAILQVEPKEIALGLSIEAVKMMELPIMIDMGKMKWLKFAYIEAGWQAEFELIFHEMIEGDFIKEGLEMGGLLCGIGGRRPEYGLFEILG